MSELVEGNDAPNFEGKDQNGNTIKLLDFKGKKLVLFFYPKDNTPGCTMEACNLRDNYDLLLEKGYGIIGVSADSETRHQNFINKYELPFPLIADTEKEILKAYGCWGPKKFMGRSYIGIHRKTFIIENNKIVKIFEKVKTKAHTQQILEAMEVN